MKKYIILFICIAIFGGIFGYFFFKEPEVEQPNFQVISSSDPIVLKLYNQVNPTNNIKTLENIYKKLSFSNEYILGTALVSYLKETNPKPEEIPEEIVQKQIYKIFGNITFAHNSGYIVSDVLCVYEYNQSKKVYTYVNGCVEDTNTKLIRQIVKAEKNLKEYIITEKMIVTKNNQAELSEDEDDVTLKIYSDINQSKLIDEIIYKNSNEPAININNYLDEASTYQYHFVFDGENFVYQSIEKVG